MDALVRRLFSGGALAAVAATFAIASPAAAQVADPPAHIAVSASLGACNARACDFSISFGAVAGAGRYEARIAAPDGSELVSAPAYPGGSSYTVPYRGDGTYVVQVFAFGTR